MSLFTTIDLSELPPPSLIEELDYETLLAATKTELQSLAPDLDVENLLESDPISKLLEVMAYRELHLRQRINESAQGVMLATATGSNLDNLAALVNIQRLEIEAGDPGASPPVPPVLEDDERLRSRTQLAFEGFSTAGPEGAYIYHAMSASALVKDVAVYSDAPGEVDVRILSSEGDGSASTDLITVVSERLNQNEIRPITDVVQVNSADIVPYSVNVTLVLFPGVGAQEVLASARAAVQTFVEKQHSLGIDITRAGLFAALYQPGVQNVQLHTPAGDILIERHQAPHGVLGTIDAVAHPTAIPSNMAAAINFTNTSTTAGTIEGTVTITAALEDLDLTHYLLYWGANNAEKLPLGTKLYSFIDNQLTLDHSGIEDLLVTSADGAVIYLEGPDFTVDTATGVVTAINNAIENTTVRIRYALPPIAEIAKGDALTHTFAADTPIPLGATHLLALSKNEYGEMVAGVSAPIDIAGQS